MKRIGAALLLGLLLLPAACRFEERKDAAIRSAAAFLMNPIVEAQSADALPPRAPEPRSPEGGAGESRTRRDCSAPCKDCPPKRAA